MYFETTQVHGSKGAKSAKDKPWKMFKHVYGKPERKEARVPVVGAGKALALPKAPSFDGLGVRRHWTNYFLRHLFLSLNLGLE